ncbi:MAG: DNA-directed RNA polymerase subunit omega [Sedimentisphaerales bacterium]|nr:DNA-directed RNA polymerase subunit omega [Sedimentisphaerales bacterium]
MLEELKSEEIVKKVGGRFKLAALVQRRMTELLQGSRPLIEDTENMTMMEIVLQEILQDKITIDTATHERRVEAIVERRDMDDDDDQPRRRGRF